MAKLADTFRKNLNRLLAGYGAQTRLRKLTGMSPTVLNRYLKGDSVPGLDAVERIAEGLNVSVGDLLYDPKHTPSDEEVVRGLVANWLELKSRAAGDEDEELFRIVDGLFRYYLEKRKQR